MGSHQRVLYEGYDLTYFLKDLSVFFVKNGLVGVGEEWKNLKIGLQIHLDGLDVGNKGKGIIKAESRVKNVVYCIPQ